MLHVHVLVYFNFEPVDWFAQNVVALYEMLEHMP
jgi:hypothetical protein